MGNIKNKIDNVKNNKLFGVRTDVLVYILLTIILAIIAVIVLVKIWLILVAALIISFIIYEKKKSKRKEEEEALRRQRDREEAERRRRAYINELSPQNPAYYMTVYVDDENARSFLGSVKGKKLRYMFVDTYKIVTFPESSYGNDRGYYLINVEFNKEVTERIQADTSSQSTSTGNIKMGGFTHTNSKSNSTSHGYSRQDPRYDNNGSIFNGGYREHIFRGTATSRSNGMFAGSGKYNGQTNSKGKINGNIIKEEVATNAFLTFVTSDKENSFTIKLEDQVEESVNSINQYFKLNDFEQNKLGLK